VAAAAAGLAQVPPGVATVALLAADLPLLDAAAVALLRATLDPPAGDPPAGDPPVGDPPVGGPTAPWDAAFFVDDGGRRQSLCGVWRVAALRAALDRLAAGRPGPAPLAGRSVRALLAGVRAVDVRSAGGPPPWFDCDTDADLRRAEGWVR
jgi:hypothetical protein